MNASYIRRISIGADYKESMNYVVGQSVFKTNEYTVSNIERTDSGSYKVWIVDSKKTQVLWKEISNSVPVIAEFNIDF